MLASAKDLHTTIQEQRVKLQYLNKHFHYPDKKSRVYMKLLFNKNDFDNIEFICKYRNQINDIIKKYSNLKLQFPVIDPANLVFHNIVDIYFTFDFDHNRATLKRFPQIAVMSYNEVAPNITARSVGMVRIGE